MNEVIQLRGLIVHHHIVIDGNDVHLFDGGFLGGVSRIRRALARHGLKFSNVKSLILSHGHLDHTLNAARIQKLTGCKVHAPLDDRAHIHGKHRYQGWSRVCGFLESVGRLLFQYSPPDIDDWFEEGDEICGFKVIALPGHTIGHCGFFDEATRQLIASDLFTNQSGPPGPPPRILNDHHAEALRSILKAAALEPKEVYLNHSRKRSPAEHAGSLQILARSLLLENQGIDESPNES